GCSERSIRTVKTELLNERALSLSLDHGFKWKDIGRFCYTQKVRQEVIAAFMEVLWKNISLIL
ncbi:MAG: hypothetical protein QMD44_12640, partial [Thermodesulfovibrionales bacterium]|nr:hypothetical protein [Thermodesulfovibrionales bacterium]